MSAFAVLRRLRRFVPQAARIFTRDVLVTAWRTLRQGLRTAWVRSDPAWASQFRTALDARSRQHEAVGARRRRRLAEQGARFAAAGRAVYEGRVYARPAARGIVLQDIEHGLHVDEWLTWEVGLDDGERRRLRLTVEPVDDIDHADTTGGDDADASPAAGA